MPEPTNALVQEPDVVAVSEAYDGDPLGDLAHGRWHPSTPAEIAWALSLLTQETTGMGSLVTDVDLRPIQERQNTIDRMLATRRAERAEGLAACQHGNVIGLCSACREAEKVKCGCTFEDEVWHDLFLTLETSAEPWVTFFAETAYVTTPEDLPSVAHFIRQHKWSDQVRMAHVAEEINVIMDQR